ncbi:MAG: hypothetical protein OHK0022_20780 [Roseiflexaceae bacterium]
MQDLTLKQALGMLIVSLRNSHHMAQGDLAEATGVERSLIEAIEQGATSPTIDTLDNIARALGQTLGSLIIQAEDMIIGKVIPRIEPSYINYSVPLPRGLTHNQLELALNRSMAILNQIGINPDEGDIQANIYSGAVSNIVTKCIAEVSEFVQNVSTRHPDLYNPSLDRNHPDWGLEMKASKQPNKGGESHNPGHGWFMVVIYKVINQQTHIIQVEIAQLRDTDWLIHDRKEGSNRTRTSITNASATQRLRENSVYLNINHITPIKPG